MLGAIIGDVIGSVYEFGNIKAKDFMLFAPGCNPTDDSIMTIAVALACLDTDCADEDSFKRALIDRMHELGAEYPDAGYGGGFYRWLLHGLTEPYNSFGNGSAMRVSPVAWVAETLEDAEKFAEWSAEVTHNHPEGIKGAQAVAAAIFLARDGKSKDEIRAHIEEKYYDLDFTIDEIRPSYSFDVTCQGSVPQAIECFLESEDFEDAIRNAVSLGGDGDTQAAIAGAIAEAYYGIPDDLSEKIMEYLDDTLSEYYWEWKENYIE